MLAQGSGRHGATWAPPTGGFGGIALSLVALGSVAKVTTYLGVLLIGQVSVTEEHCCDEVATKLHR